MYTEIELKLRIAAQHVARVQRHPLLRAMTRGDTVTRLVHSVYYDTPERDLWRRGMALRLRRVARGWVQTLKSGGGAAAGLHQRNELEAPVARQQLDFTQFAAPQIAELFADPQLRAALAPVFVTRCRRATRLLETPAGARVELAFDRGEVSAGDAHEPICELELELKAGSATGLFEIARALIADGGVALEHLSKAERGFALLSGRAPVKAAAAEFAPDANAGEAFAAIVRTCLAHMQSNERGVLAGRDPEYVHQMRVALRRLRSAFNVFAPLAAGETGTALTAELKWLAGELGPARDWDVFVGETLPPLAAEFHGHAGLGTLAGEARQLQRTANRAARAALASRRYQELLLAFGEMLASPPPPPAAGEMQPSSQPVLGFAIATLARAHARVHKRGRRIAGQSPPQLHRLRIAIKKLRYAADFFAGLYPRKLVRPYVERLAGLQQMLGAINDAATTTQLMSSIAASGALRREALGIIMGWNASARTVQHAQLARAWQAFRRAKVFW